MPDWVIIIIVLAVLIGVVGYLIWNLVAHIRQVRRQQGVQRIWANFGLSIAFCILFLVSWSAQAVAEWGVYRSEQQAMGEPASLSGYVVEFGQSTLENWQSEFLQLFSFVVLAALLIHRDSAESKDSDERIEKKIDAIAKRLEELEPTKVGS
jgi:H+/Cl- antiporter ClcA